MEIGKSLEEEMESVFNEIEEEISEGQEDDTLFSNSVHVNSYIFKNLLLFVSRNMRVFMFRKENNKLKI